MGLLRREKAVAVNRHEGGDRRCRDGALRGNGGSRVGGDGARDLPVRGRRIRNQIDEGGAYAFVTRGLGIRDVAGDILEREGLRLQTRHGSIESIEDTHNIVSKFDPCGQPICKNHGRIRRRLSQALCQYRNSIYFKYLNRKPRFEGPGHNCRAGNNCREQSSA